MNEDQLTAYDTEFIEAIAFLSKKPIALVRSFWLSSDVETRRKLMLNRLLLDVVRARRPKFDLEDII